MAHDATVESANESAPPAAGHATPSSANLLEQYQTDPAATAARIFTIWTAQDPAERRRHQYRQRNKLWVKGYPGVAVVPTTADMSEFKLDIGYGLSDMKPVGSRLATLIRRLAAHQYVDQPVPQVDPSKDTDESENAAEFSERLLEEDGGLSGTNDIARFMGASQRSSVVASAFTYLWVDPYGGGWRPMQMEAHPMAKTVQDAAIDPTTGRPADPNTLELRYVGEGDQLTDDASQAQKQWLPKVCPEDVSVYQVRPIPATARDIDHCTGCMVLLPWTLGAMKASFPPIAELSPEDQQALVNWRPIAAKWALPWYLAKKDQNLPKGPDDEPNDDEIVWSLAWYAKSTPAYPNGAYILTTGAKYGLYAGEWSTMVDTPDGKAPFQLDLPIAQCQSLTDEEQPDFYGRAIVDDIGPSDELAISIIDGARTHSERFLYPHTFLPMGSTVQPEQLNVRGIAPIPYNAAGGGMPVVETVPPFDPTSMKLLEYATQASDDALGLFMPAQGQQTASVNSARQGAQLIQQSYANIATIVQNSKRYIARYWRIKLQLMRAFYTIPQRIRFMGDDGSYKERDWSGVDLDGATSVTIRVGSFTQMAPSEKEEYVTQMMTPAQPGLQPLIDFEEGQRLLASNMSARIGRMDNPHRLRIGRQMAAWRDGPPEGWEQQAEAYQAAKQRAEMVTQSLTQSAQAQGVPPEVAIPKIQQESQAVLQGAQQPSTPFDILPCDEEPPIAKIRHAELSRLMATKDFQKFQGSPAWQAVLVEAYQHARLAAGLLLPAEQAAQQAQQQQQMAQQQAQAAAQQDQTKAASQAQGVQDKMALAEHARSIAPPTSQAA